MGIIIFHLQIGLKKLSSVNKIYMKKLLLILLAAVALSCTGDRNKEAGNSETEDQNPQLAEPDTSNTQNSDAESDTTSTWDQDRDRYDRDSVQAPQ
jgi:hypothetical protein